MTVSIVIPVKNEEKVLPRLLRSIHRQSMQPVEVIVADANSTDSTRYLAQAMGAQVVDGGLPGSGRNRGAEVATGKYILFLDADVELHDPNFLQRAIDQVKDRQLAIATVDVAPIDGTPYDNLSHKFYNRYVRLWGAKHPHAPGFCMLVRRDIHNQIGGFDESVIFAEDHEYAGRASKKGKFGFLSGIAIPVSVRRQNRDGRINMGIKYILAELHILTLGPIRHNKFNYTFGYGKKGKKSIV
ncbi:MAG: glycosyltransferase [bacterium]